MHMRRIMTGLGWTLGMGAAALLGGCGEIVNPDFISSLGGGDSAASIPGEAPALLVTVENRTRRTAEALLSYRDPNDQVKQATYNLIPGSNIATALVCPIDEVTLGDVSDLRKTGAIIRLGNGGSNDAFIEVEPFGVLLQDQANYNCGDSITFAIVESSATRSGYQVFAFIQRSGITTTTSGSTTP